MAECQGCCCQQPCQQLVARVKHPGWCCQQPVTKFCALRLQRDWTAFEQTLHHRKATQAAECRFHLFPTC
ncbi:MAG: hypothetical protein ACK55Z_27590 [bacterium]